VIALLSSRERAWGEQRVSTASRADVVARVNGEPITRAEHRRMRDNPVTRRQLQDERTAGGAAPEELDRLALRKLIHLRLLLQEARRRGLTVTEKELDAAIVSLRRRFEDLASFGAWMKEQGLDEESLFESVRADMMAERVAWVLAWSARVGEDDVRRYREAHQEEMTLGRAEARAEIERRLLAARRREALDAWLASQEAKSSVELVSDIATPHAGRGN
jgi:hypothetical protein